MLPVSWCGNHELRGELKGVDNSEHFVEVSASRGGVSDHQLDFLVGADHKYASDGEHGERLGVDHAVEIANCALGISNHREVHGTALSFTDILLPFDVRLDGIDRETDDLNIALLEFWLDLGDVAELSGANRGEVLRVRKEHTPAVSKPLVEVNRAQSGLGGKIRRNVS